MFGYVVMPEHVHLLISEPEENLLGRAMQILKTRVAISARRLEDGLQGIRPCGKTATLITMCETIVGL